MTGPHPETESSGNRQISVAELLARQGVTGAPARRRRRRRGDSDAITVAELTGEIPIIRDDHHHAGPDAHASQSPAANGRVQVGEAAPQSPAEPVAEQVAEEPTRTVYWSQPEPRWPKSPPQDRRESGPELSEYPRPLRHTHSDRAPAGPPSGAEHMSPDPVEHYPDLWVDVLDTEVGEAEAETEVREAQPGRGERHAAAAAAGTTRGGWCGRGAGCPSCPGRGPDAVARRVGRAAVDPGRCLRCRVVHRLRPVVALEQHSGASAIGDGHPWPSGLGAGSPQDRRHRQYVDRGCGGGADYPGTAGLVAIGLAATTHSAPSNQSRLVDGLGVPVAGRGRVRVRRQAWLRRGRADGLG